MLGGRVRVGDEVIDGDHRRPQAEAAEAAHSARLTAARPTHFQAPLTAGKRTEQTMAELTISQTRSAAPSTATSPTYQPDISREEVGTVTESGDGIATVEGLPSDMANELLEFATASLGLALNLDVREIGVVILGDFTGIEEGPQVRAHRRDPLRPGRRRLPRPGGRTPLGSPIDGLGEIARPTGRAPLELQAADRGGSASRCKEPLQTGIKAIDAMTRDRPGPAPADHR